VTAAKHEFAPKWQVVNWQIEENYELLDKFNKNNQKWISFIQQKNICSICLQSEGQNFYPAAR